jgi:tetratricopeptide (TPR) repeat protein
LDLSLDLSLLATVAGKQGNLASALSSWQRIIDIRRALVDADPKDARSKGRLVFAYLRSGSTRMKMKDYRSALPDLENALALSEGLVAVNPEDGISRRYMAQALANTGYSEHALAKSPAAAAGERRTHRARACKAFARALEVYATSSAQTVADATDRKAAVAVEKEVAKCKH